MSDSENTRSQIDNFHPRLHGIREDVKYGMYSGIRLYHNTNTIKFDEHWHTALEILYPLVNSYTVKLDSNEYVVKAGDILVIAPGTIHSYTPPESGERIFLLVDYSNLENIPSIRNIIQAIRPYVLISQDAYPPLNEVLRKILDFVIDEYDESGPYTDTLVLSKIVEFLVYIGRTDIYRATHTKSFTNDNRQEYIAKFMEVCNYITDHISEDITVDQLAAVAGFSKFHFSRIFKSLAGMPCHEYLIQRRLEVAEQLLADPNISITDVAMRSGFNSISTFSRIFKEEKNITPSAYRKITQDDPSYYLQDGNH